MSTATPAADAEPRFCAYAAEDGRPHAHLVPDADDFAEAAAMFAETWHPTADPAGEMVVIVIDRHSGEEQCFVVDLAGEAEPCT